MSSNSTLTLFLVSLLATGVWAAGAYNKLPNSGNVKISHTHKLSAGTELKIRRASDDPVTPGKPFTLEASLEVDSEKFHNASAEWVLPKGVRMVSGQQVTPISNVRTGHVLKLRGSFVSDVETNKVIRLKVLSGKGLKLASGTYHTLNQDRNEEETAAIVERGRQYLLDNPEKIKKHR